MLNDLSKEIHQNAVNHGWWDKECSFGEFIALCHSELSEALEEYRNNRKGVWFLRCINSENCHKEFFCHHCEKSKPEGIPIELADVIIRILDYCGKENIDIEKAIQIKHEYNKTRPYKHGGKII